MDQRSGNRYALAFWLLACLWQFRCCGSFLGLHSIALLAQPLPPPACGCLFVWQGICTSNFVVLTNATAKRARTPCPLHASLHLHSADAKRWRSQLQRASACRFTDPGRASEGLRMQQQRHRHIPNWLVGIGTRSSSAHPTHDTLLTPPPGCGCSCCVAEPEKFL